MVYSWLYNTQSLNAVILVFSTDLFLKIDWPNVVHTLWISYTAYTCNIVCFLYFSYSCTICFQHSIDIVHSNSRRPFVNSHLFIYIDGNLKLGSQLKFPNVSEVHTNTRKRHSVKWVFTFLNGYLRNSQYWIMHDIYVYMIFAIIKRISLYLSWDVFLSLSVADRLPDRVPL